MEFTVRTSDLARELALAQGVVDSNPTIPALSNVLLEAEGSALKLTTTDLELAILTACPANVQAAGQATVPMKYFHDYVRLLPDSELAVKASGSNSLRLECGRATTRLQGMSVQNFPQIGRMPESVTKVDTSLLAEAARKTAISIADEQSHYALGGALVVPLEDSLTIVSTDGHRLSLFSNAQTLPGVADAKTLLSRKGMNVLQRILGSEGPRNEEGQPLATEYAEDENTMFFKWGQRTLVARKLTGKFPDYTRVLPQDLSIELTLHKDSFVAALRRVALFAGARAHSRPVRFELEDGQLILKAGLTDFGDSVEAVDVEYTGDSFETGFNSTYILDFLAQCEQEKVVMCLKDPRAAAQLQIPDLEIPGTEKGLDYRYVIMPIRV